MRRASRAEVVCSFCRNEARKIPGFILAQDPTGKTKAPAICGQCLDDAVRYLNRHRALVIASVTEGIENAVIALGATPPKPARARKGENG